MNAPSRRLTGCMLSGCVVLAVIWGAVSFRKHRTTCVEPVVDKLIGARRTIYYGQSDNGKVFPVVRISGATDREDVFVSMYRRDGVSQMSVGFAKMPRVVFSNVWSSLSSVTGALTRSGSVMPPGRRPYLRIDEGATVTWLVEERTGKAGEQWSRIASILSNATDGLSCHDRTTVRDINSMSGCFGAIDGEVVSRGTTNEQLRLR